METDLLPKIGTKTLKDVDKYCIDEKSNNFFLLVYLFYKNSYKGEIIYTISDDIIFRCQSR